MPNEHRSLSESYLGFWSDILIYLGIPAKALVNRQGPCPLCGGKTRFRYDNKHGRGTWICSHCGAGDGPDLAMRFTGLKFRDLAGIVRHQFGGSAEEDARVRAKHIEMRPQPSPIENERRRSRMNDLWRRSHPVGADDPAGRYLRSRLGVLPVNTGLRFVERCAYQRAGVHPAMLAMFTGPDGKPSGLHRTYLTAEGLNASLENVRLTMGRLVDGGAARLAPAGRVLGIAEGIETALAASIQFGVPVWAALNAGRLAVWVPSEAVEEVVIFADNDKSFAGQTAAFVLQKRLSARFKSTIETPAQEGRDWNEVLRSTLVAHPR